MRKYKVTYAALLAGTLVAGQLAGSMASPVADAAGAAKKAVVSTAAAAFKFNSVPLGAGVTAVLEDVNFWSQAGGSIVTYTLKYTNSGSTNAKLGQYFSRVITSGGSVLPGNPIGTNAQKKKLGAKETLKVTYYVNAGQTSSLQGLKISMLVWDAKTKGYLKQAGAFAVPANYTTTVAAGSSLSTTMNDIPVSARGESLQLYKYGGKVYAKVGLSLTNKGNKVLGDPGYTAYLISASGTSFELALSAQTDYKIQPQEKRSIYYITEIPAYLKTDKMKLQFTQKDETLKLELPKSAYKLPAATTPNLVVGNGVIKKIVVNSNTIETQLRNANVYAQDADAIWTFQMQLKNTGNKAVTLPSYELAIKSVKGTAFPVSAKALSGLTLKPLETKVIPLTVRVPLEVEQSGLLLQMIEAVGADTPSEPITPGTPGTPVNSGSAGSAGTAGAAKMTFPVAYFVIPYALRADVQTGQEYRTTNSYGSFAYTVQSVQRYPWKNDDIVAAKLRITNTQAVSLTLPELKGAIKLDNKNSSTPADLFMADSDAKVLAPGQYADLVVLGKVPYTDEFSDLGIALTGTENTETIPFLDMSIKNSMNNINTIAQGESYAISGKGKNASVQEKSTVVYEGANYNLLYTELLLSSSEKRQSKMARLQAYFRTKDGQYYEATPSQSDNNASPGGKQLVVFWSKLPKTADYADLSLYLGTGVNGGKLSESGQETTGFVNVSSLLLAPHTTVPAGNLLSVALYPYTISFLASEGRHVKDSEEINISFNYSLQRNNIYDTGVLEHKLILQITDPFGLSQERTLALGTDLTEGINNVFNLSISRNMYKSLEGGTYQLTLYDEFQGERMKLGAQVYRVAQERPLKTQ